MAQNDDVVFNEFTRAREEGVEVVLEVCVIDWKAGPHTPHANWIEVGRLATGSGALMIQSARGRLLKRRRFFRVCSLCAKRNPVGWMHNSRICHACAERTLGVVY